MSNQENESLQSKLKAVGNNPLAWLAILIALVAMSFIKPAKWLTKEAYTKAGALSWLFGAGLSVAAGIAVGHHLGWQLGLDLLWWLPFGLLSLFATYYYVYPLTYLALFQWSFKVGRKLWDRVPQAGERTANKYGFSPWLSNLLVKLAHLVATIAAVVLFFNLASGIQTKLGWDSGFFWLVGWALSIAGAGILSFIAGALANLLISQAGVPFIALAGGGYLAHHYTAALESVSGSYGLPSWTVWAMQAAVVIVFVAYIFPIAHLFLTRILRPIGELIDSLLRNFFKTFGDLLETAYADRDSNYVGLLKQTGNIALAGAVGYATWGYLGGEGYTLVPSVLATSLAVLASYLIIGGALTVCEFGVLAFLGNLAGVTYLVGFNSTVNGYLLSYIGEFGLVVRLVIGVVSMLLVSLIVYPVAYNLARAVLRPLLAGWLGPFLVSTYRTLADEIFSAFSRTYGDNTCYAPFFAHVTNVAATAATVVGVAKLMALLSFTPVTSLTTVVLVSVSVYLLGGKLLARYKNSLIGTLVAISVGLYAGVAAYDHFAENYWWGIAGFVAAALATGFIGFPLVYVVVRAVLNAVRVDAWLAPLVIGVHNFFFGFVEAFWNMVVRAYRAIEASMLPYWRRASQMVDEAWEAAMTVVRHVFGSKDDK